MPYVAHAPEKYLGKSVGNGQCVAFARAAAALGPTRNWQRGVLVRGAQLVPGTVIATFREDGVYENDTSGRSHAAIYLGQNAVGIVVLDQWVERKTAADGSVELRLQPVHQRTIRFQNNVRPVNDGRKYYVVD